LAASSADKPVALSYAIDRGTAAIPKHFVDEYLMWPNSLQQQRTSNDRKNDKKFGMGEKHDGLHLQDKSTKHSAFFEVTVTDLL